jgi:tetratricopeptide (TPR) repeat protein
MDMTEGTLTRTDAKRSIWKSLEASGFQNLLIAQMLVNLHDRGRDLERARELYERLLQFHSRERLYFAEAQVAFLELNFEKALAAVEKWVRIDPFNSGAGTSLTYLLTEVTNDFDRAIQVGEAYLRRLDDRDVLLNNVAYAMVLSGRFDEADKLLERGFDAPHVAATRGLLRIRRGEIDSGVASYDHAIKLAEQLHDEQLARLVRANKLAALDDLGPDSDELANDPDLKDDPRYQLLRHGLLGPSSV